MKKNLLSLAALFALAAQAQTTTVGPITRHAGQGTGMVLSTHGADLQACVNAAPVGTSMCKVPVVKTAAPPPLPPVPPPAPNPPAPTPATWQHIAKDGESFTVEGTKTVRFGDNPSWVQRQVTGAGQCNGSFMGGYPVARPMTCQVLTSSAPPAPQPPAPPPPAEPPAPPPPAPPPPAPPPPAPNPPAPPPPSSGYDVERAYSLLPAPGLTRPAVPRTTVEYAPVRNDSELDVALSQAGRSISCVPGSAFTRANVRSADTRLNLTACTLTGPTGVRPLNITAQRVEFIGGTVNAGPNVMNAQDVHLRGSIFNTGVANAEILSSQRVLLNGVRHFVTNNNIALWVMTSTGVVVANSVYDNTGRGQSTIRHHSSSVAIVDSCIRNLSHHTLRAHAEPGRGPSPYVVWARNVIAGGHVQAWGGTGDPVQVTDMWITDNRMHANATAHHLSYPSVQRATITDNDSRSTGFGGWATGPGWTVSGNTQGAYSAAPACDVR